MILYRVIQPNHFPDPLAESIIDNTGAERGMPPDWSGEYLKQNDVLTQA